jgi:cell division protein FtsQ
VAEEGRRRDAAVATAADVLPLPSARSRRRPPSRAAWLPSTRSLLACAGLVAAAVVAYVVAFDTSAFALRTVDVEGASPAVADSVRTALAPLVGRTLLDFNRGEASRRVLGLPAIVSARFDRDFPHTLRVFVQVARPTAVVRQGSLAWLVSSAGKVLRTLPSRPYPSLPRVWLPRSQQVSVGATLAGYPAIAIRAVEPLTVLQFPETVRSVEAGQGRLDLQLASGIVVRLGDVSDLRLKLAVAARILPLSTGATYIDVTVPERAVAGFNPQPAG